MRFSLIDQLVHSFARTPSTYPEPWLELYAQLLARLLLAVAAVGWVAPRAPREVPATAT